MKKIRSKFFSWIRGFLISTISKMRKIRPTSNSLILGIIIGIAANYFFSWFVELNYMTRTIQMIKYELLQNEITIFSNIRVINNHLKSKNNVIVEPLLIPLSTFIWDKAREERRVISSRPLYPILSQAYYQINLINIFIQRDLPLYSDFLKNFGALSKNEKDNFRIEWTKNLEGYKNMLIYCEVMCERAINFLSNKELSDKSLFSDISRSVSSVGGDNETIQEIDVKRNEILKMLDDVGIK